MPEFSSDTQNASDNERIYTDYLNERALDRDSLLNPQVTWQNLSARHSKMLALQRIQPNFKTVKILDVGCGAGAGLLFYSDMGFKTENLIGIDIWKKQIQEGKSNIPSFNLICGDASQMEFSNNSFDIVSESTMFLQITDNILAKKIAEEMIRVLKPGGHLIITDWRYGKPGNTTFCPVNMKRLTYLFDIGKKTTLIKKYSGALVPPLGRLLSKYAPVLYMSVRYLFPFTVGMKTYLLKK